MADKTAEMPPQYPGDGGSFAPKRTKHFLFGLVFYAGAVTAALITVAVLGSMYLQQLDEPCKQGMREGVQESSKSIKHYSAKDPMTDAMQETDIDTEANKEVIYIKAEDGTDDVIIVFDFKASVGGVYVRDSENCYVIGGLDKHIPDASQLDWLYQNEGSRSYSNDTELAYTVLDEYPVKELNVLPRELHGVCWGKDVFWLSRTTPRNDDVTKRFRWCKKVRIFGITFNVCFQIGFG